MTQVVRGYISLKRLLKIYVRMSVDCMYWNVMFVHIIGQDTRSFKQMSTGIRINNRLIFIPLLVDGTLNITFEVPWMN